MSVFGVILFHIFLNSDRIRTAFISPYSVRMRENADQNNSECGLFLRSVSNMITSLPAVLSNIISINKRRLNCYGKWYTGEVIHVIMLPHPLPPKKIQKKASLPKVCGFSFVMVGKTLITNQCFVECIIFCLLILTYRFLDSFLNSVRRPIAL